MSGNSTLAALGHAASGAAGTAVATAAVFPLDLVTTRLKAQRVRRASSCSVRDSMSGGEKPGREGHGAPQHHQHHQNQRDEAYHGILQTLRTVAVREDGGIAALYRGLGPDVAKSVLDSFLFFGFYSYLRARNRHRGAVAELALGALAGAASRALTTPISTVVTRMQVGAVAEAHGGDNNGAGTGAGSPSSSSLLGSLAAIYREGGLGALWSGYSATLFLTLNPSITFFVNRRLARRILPALEEEDIPVAWAAFLLAALSKAAATALTYPFQTGRLRLQMAADVDADYSDPFQSSPSPSPSSSSSSSSSSTSSFKSTTSSPTNDASSLSNDKAPLSFLLGLLRRLRHMLGESVVGVIFRVVATEGRAALYDGLRGELLKGFLSHGLTMLFKGLCFRLVLRLWLLSRQHARQRVAPK